MLNVSLGMIFMQLTWACAGVEPDELQAAPQPGGAHRLHQHGDRLPGRLPVRIRRQGVTATRTAIRIAH